MLFGSYSIGEKTKPNVRLGLRFARGALYFYACSVKLLEGSPDEIGALPPRKLTEMIKEARNYSFDFLKWKKAYELRKHWLAHTKSVCPRDGTPLVKAAKLGKRQRRAFYCETCQVLYAG